MTTLVERINAVMNDVKALEADKRHEQQGYGYISADKILSRVGEAMVSHGIAIIPECTGHTTTLHEITSYGKTKNLWHVDAELSMTVTDGETESVKTWAGSGVDYATPDKALYKAITSGHKYFIMKLFMVGVGNEDGEHGAYDEPSAVKRVKANDPSITPPPVRRGQPPFSAEPRSPDSVVAALQTHASKNANPANDGQLKFMRASLSKLVGSDADKASHILAHVFGLESSKDATSGQASAIIDWAGANKDNEYTVSPISAQEAERINTAFLIAAGQGSLFDE